MEMIDQSLGQLARRIPGATRVFDAHDFDFCSGNTCPDTVYIFRAAAVFSHFIECDIHLIFFEEPIFAFFKVNNSGCILHSRMLLFFFSRFHQYFARQ